MRLQPKIRQDPLSLKLDNYLNNITSKHFFVGLQCDVPLNTSIEVLLLDVTLNPRTTKLTHFVTLRFKVQAFTCV